MSTAATSGCAAHGVDDVRRQRLRRSDRGLHAGPDEEVGLQRLAHPVDDRLAEAADHHRDRDHHRQAHRQGRHRDRQARNRRGQVRVGEQAVGAEAGGAAAAAPPGPAGRAGPAPATTRRRSSRAPRGSRRAAGRRPGRAAARPRRRRARPTAGAASVPAPRRTRDSRRSLPRMAAVGGTRAASIAGKRGGQQRQRHADRDGEATCATGERRRRRGGGDVQRADGARR